MSEPKKIATTLQTPNQNTEKLLWLFGFRTVFNEDDVLSMLAFPEIEVQVGRLFP
ncbi:hypothetical protein QUB70_24805 [Microcoleus sp. A003_D6]|uniref:hypothetical protein n=1 Tax=Microcoleus sp. A003_D6 TaxID=3055266 RepID=UPI002FD65EF3